MTERKITIIFEDFEKETYEDYILTTISENNYILIFNKKDHELIDLIGYDFDTIYEIMFDDFKQFYKPFIEIKAPEYYDIEYNDFVYEIDKRVKKVTDNIYTVTFDV